jgi:acetyl-CoA acyltransferase
MSDDIWILGITMTKFGKHPDLDTVDLAAEAARGALADAGVTMRDVGVLAAGNLMAANAGIGQQLQKQIGQTGIPVYNVANACATGATALRTAIMAVKAGECDMGLAVGVEKLAGAGLLGGGGTPKSDKKVYEPKGRYGAVANTDGRIGTNTMPGVFAQVGMQYLYEHEYGGTPFELFAKISEKNHSHSTLNPLAAYTKKMSLEQIMGDMMIAYPNTRPMCSANCDGAAAAVVVSGAKLKTLSKEQQRRAVKVSASVLTSDPWQEACQVLPDVNTLTRLAATQAYEAAGWAPTTSTWSSCTTASPPRSWSTTTTSSSARRAARSTSSSRVRRGVTAGSRSTSPAACSPRVTPSPPPASPTSGRSATTSAARPATARSRAPRWAWPTSSASAPPAASTSSRRPPPRRPPPRYVSWAKASASRGVPAITSRSPSASTVSAVA